jgi:hypothetical protein
MVHSFSQKDFSPLAFAADLLGAGLAADFDADFDEDFEANFGALLAGRHCVLSCCCLGEDMHRRNEADAVVYIRRV